jgi:phosphoribosylformylglycinamidine synthase
VFDEKRADLLAAWSETSYRMQALRDNPECAREEFAGLLAKKDPGLHVELSFDLNEDVAAPYVKKKRAQPKIAILREQGVNGEVEMAAAFARAGFTPVDVHMSDILAGRVKLKNFKGLAACGGFSYGDVLGAGGGWAASIFCTMPAPAMSSRPSFSAADSFALGVCNGCQMMSRLSGIIPGAENWPRFERNLSEQFEARFVMVEVPKTPSILFDGMAGSRMPVVVSHGEGRAVLATTAGAKPAAKRKAAEVCLRYVDNRGRKTETYPMNPNGSPKALPA